MDIGEKIRKEKVKKGLKQCELANKSEISNMYLSDIEVARTTLSLRILMKIAEALGVDCTIFLKPEST